MTFGEWLRTPFAGVALWTDLVTHFPSSKHFLHLNTVNGLLGAPVVMLMIARRRNRRALEL